MRNSLFARLLRSSSAQEVRASTPQRRLLSIVGILRFSEAKGRCPECIPEYEDSHLSGKTACFGNLSHAQCHDQVNRPQSGPALHWDCKCSCYGYVSLEVVARHRYHRHYLCHGMPPWSQERTSRVHSGQHLKGSLCGSQEQPQPPAES